MTDPKPFTLPEWESIWVELNKLVEDLPVEEVEARWGALMQKGWQLASDLQTLADNIGESLEMMQTERDHHMQMFGSLLDDGEEHQESS